MPVPEPRWWYESTGQCPARWLAPLAWFYGTAAQLRCAIVKSSVADHPVICIGNFTSGGTGKTPVALAVADLIAELGYQPFFLSRGYGGRATGPLAVDCEQHTAGDVGDEPLLLARRAPAFIARDRRAGAAAIARVAPDNAVIIMDDGLQNPSLAKDLAIAVVSGQRGLGNGRVIPSGPLRAPLAFQVRRADVIIVNGHDSAGITGRLASITPFPILSAQTAAIRPADWRPGTAIVAYAGIAHPQRFFGMLRDLGADLKAEHTFPDHHSFSNEDARRLLSEATRFGARLMTTEKDLARLAGAAGPLAELRAASSPLAIAVTFQGHDRAILSDLIKSALAKRTALASSSGR